jgi:predicted secreted Zn-dependent protease
MPRLWGLAWAVACLAALALWPADARAGPDVRVTYETYRVQGDSLAAVWRDIAAKAPRALRTGLHAQAESRIRYRWTVGYAATAAGCAATRPGVSVNVVIRVPEWSGAAAAPPPLRAAWQRYIAAVLEHEEEHRAIAEDTARRLHAFLAGAPRHGSCRALARQIDHGVEGIMAEERRRQSHFDRIAPAIRLR